MKTIEGIVGDKDCDGWVHWTTYDMGMSYNPSISCGDAVYVLSLGEDWGALAEDAWALHYDSYSEDPPEPTTLARLIRSANDLRRFLVGHAAFLGMTHNLPWLAQACDELWAALHPEQPAIIPTNEVWTPYRIISQ